MSLPCRMKTIFSTLRGRAFSLLLIVLVCATVLMWAWERTSLITTFLPPRGLFQVSPAETEAKEKSILRVEKNGDAETSISLAEAEGGHEEKIEKNLKTEAESSDFAALPDSGNTSSTVKEQNNENVTYPVKHDQETEKNLKLEGQFSEFSPLVGCANASSIVKERHNENVAMLTDDQGCNYAKGKWVVDDRRPLYSGFHCKQWLSQMWACRLMQRKDFAYEKIRWQPKNCQMGEFEGSKFLERMRDRTLAFVGDSLGRQQFQSLMCMITGGKESPHVMDVGKDYGLITPQGGARPSGWAYRFPSTNTTVLYYWSSCLCDLKPINIENSATDYAMHLDRPPAFLQQYLHKLDVLVLNTGHHWNRGKLKANRWVMYVGGMPNTNRKLTMIGDAKNFTIHSIVKWLNSQLPKHPHLKAFYRSISPRHFVNGDWNTGGSCDNTTPMSIGKEALQDESSDYSAGNAVKGTGVKLLDITALSQLRDEGHISQYSIAAAKGVQDCLHWCLPGVPDTWNEILFAHVSATS